MPRQPLQRPARRRAQQLPGQQAPAAVLGRQRRQSLRHTARRHPGPRVLMPRIRPQHRGSRTAVLPLPPRREWLAQRRRMWPRRGSRAWRRPGWLVRGPARSPISAAAVRTAAVPPSISAAAGDRMVVAHRRAAVAAEDRMAAVVAAARDISSRMIVRPERSPATPAFIGHQASQRRRIRTVVVQNQLPRSAMRRLAIGFFAINFFAGALVFAGALIAAVPAFAQEEPPARVGRVSFVEGQLGFHLTGETVWSAAKPNYPIATGGSFWTDPKSRAELRIGSRTIDLSGNTELDITKLNEQVMQLALPQGRVDLRVRSLLEGESIQIDLPRGAVWILQPGTYDIDAGAEGQPERIAVFEGSARFVGGTLDVAIKAGDAAVISGTQTLTATEKASPDEFAKWCRSRDYDERKLAAPYRVSPQMTGYEELDQYGSWRAVPQYGEVWFPKRVASGWARYREGQWVWRDLWGWNWVDDEPWGFAPFHYGRWAMVEDQWAWVPGEFVPQPVYAPALVAFVGDPGVGYWDVADVGPAVGWFPLGPGEIYWPSYSRNRNYFRNINIANVSRSVIDPIANATASRGTADPPPQVRDQRFTNRNAMTVVPARIFANAAPVAPAAKQMPRPVVQQAVQQAPVSLRPPQLAPVSARAQATPTTPRAGGAGARGTSQAPTASAPAAPGVAHAPGAPPPSGIAHAPPTASISTAGTPGAHAPPTAAGIH